MPWIEGSGPALTTLLPVINSRKDTVIQRMLKCLELYLPLPLGAPIGYRAPTAPSGYSCSLEPVVLSDCGQQMLSSTGHSTILVANSPALKQSDLSGVTCIGCFWGPQCLTQPAF